MLRKINCRDVVAKLQASHKLIALDTDSLAVTKALWQAWEAAGNIPPNINEIAKDFAKHESGYFYELVKVAEKLEGNQFNIHYCQFSLENYNAYALSAKDGYIILVDDVFYQFLYFLCNILVFDAMNCVKAGEKEEVKKFIDKIISVNYFNRQRIDFSQPDIHQILLKRD